MGQHTRSSAAERDGDLLPNRRNCVIVCDASSSIPGIFGRRGRRLPCRGKFQSAIAGMDCSKDPIGNRAKQSNSNEAHSTCLIHRTLEWLRIPLAQRCGNMFVHEQPGLAMPFPYTGVTKIYLDIFAVFCFFRKVHRNGCPCNVATPSYF
jgi:hypothetical protein